MFGYLDVKMFGSQSCRNVWTDLDETWNKAGSNLQLQEWKVPLLLTTLLDR